VVDEAELPAEADALYDERPEDFVAARNTLAKSLRADKRRDDAKAVADLRKPSVASWALNQVARRRSALVDDLVHAGDSLQAATARAVAGKRGDLRAAADAQRKALDAVVDAAVAMAGDANADQLRRRATNTLHAATADEVVAAQLRAGRLDEDHDAPGFGFGFSGVVVDDAEDDTDEDDEAAAAADQAARDAEIARRRALAEQLDAAATAAEEAARAARAEADAAKAALDEFA
jgi:hypothetical protein